MNFGQMVITEEENWTEYLAKCSGCNSFFRYYDMETDAKMYNAMFGNRPLWG